MQAECLNKDGVLSGRNLVFSAPTSAGKSAVAQVLMLRRRMMSGSGTAALLVLPYNALCHENQAKLERLFAPLDLCGPAFRRACIWERG